MAIPKIHLFASPEYVRRITQVNLAVDDDRIVPAIILAQDKHLQPYLGTRLYDRLLAILSGSSASANETLLLDTHCRRVVVWWTVVELLPDLHTFIDAGGLLTRAPEGSEALDPAQMSKHIERARGNAAFYTTRMIDYLLFNQSLYPEYTKATEEEMPAETSAYYQSGMTISGRTNLRDLRNYYNAIFPLSNGSGS
ncbi:MAG: hypothetical protein Unbinned1529contig1001_19 [Prokaryotic dsDNA virus sp.]|nr:MAG: hypothetical protein Unbinned1529contig1001_19 [Prokaryotic dsDNA virus sp.]|tara:strand:+ start:6839 stop:7426 length:588 start_codon:yes stop_codon:yes gene_type:complete